jgi:mannose-6-phosphate isomerase-like protein (cupin superfamily)
VQVLKVEIMARHPGEKHFISFRSTEEGYLRVLARGRRVLPVHYAEKRLHGGKDEIAFYTIMRGKAKLTNGKEVVTVDEPTLVYFPAGEKHRISNVSEEVEAAVLLIRIEKPKPGEFNIPPDFG